MNRSKIIKTIAIQLLKAAIIASVAAVLSIFIADQISKIGDMLIEKRKLILVMEKRTETISKIRADLKITGNNGNVIENAMPPKDNILDFTAALENIANKNSLQYSYKFGTPVDFSSQDGLDISAIDYNLIVNGNIFTLINYLKDFERLRYFTGISSINLTAPQDTGWEGNSSMTIQARLYSK